MEKFDFTPLEVIAFFIGVVFSVAIILGLVGTMFYVSAIFLRDFLNKKR